MIDDVAGGGGGGVRDGWTDGWVSTYTWQSRAIILWREEKAHPNNPLHLLAVITSRRSSVRRALVVGVAYAKEKSGAKWREHSLAFYISLHGTWTP